MESLITTYQNRIDQYQLKINTLKKKLLASSIIRLLVFLAGVAGIYFLWGNGALAAVVGLIAFSLFLYLVARHENIKRERDFYKALVSINQTEIKVIKGEFDHIPDGSNFIDQTHEYSHDIDLFGKASFYQYINRCVTHDGQKKLSHLLTRNSITNITQQQEAVKELSSLLDFRQEYIATATLLEQEKQPSDMLEWIEKYNRFVPDIFKWLPWLMIGLSTCSSMAYFNDLISGWVVAGLFMINLAITRQFLKKINKLSAQISKLDLFFKQYSKLIMNIEKQEFSAQQLAQLKQRIMTSGIPASQSLDQLSIAIARLDQRYNMLFGFLANGLGLWDLKQVHSIEKWLVTHKENVGKWLDTAAQIEALISLGNYAYNHPMNIYPSIQDTDFTLQLKDVKHPLLDPHKAIGNDVNINTGEFFIVTGANMAGKSTFLRTISMTIVMANAGLPVWASKASYAPVKLITSMRTSDSLTDDESYFFSELKRLQFIVNQIHNDRYFIVLDEILKGTNSQDKANGSRKLIEKLSRNHATGIIATHDLSLTQVAQEYDSISNYYFDADITNDELSFDYTFKPGVATNMNASFLLRKMGIVDE